LKTYTITPLLILNIVSVVFYYWIVSIIRIEVNFKTMFATNDAITYREVAHWISEGASTEKTAIRPILYPLFLVTSSKIGGVFGIWFFQFIMWLLSINLVFLALKILTKSHFWAYSGALILLSNLSFIALTFHALTEVLSVFLLASIIYISFKNKEGVRSFSFFRNLILFFVLLTLVKPVFYIPLLGLIFIISPLLYFKLIFQNGKNIMIIGLILSPLIVQLALVKYKHNKLTVSTISAKTVDEYILAQSIVDKYKIERDSALINVSSMTSEEKTTFVKKNFSLVANRFKRNIEGNILSAPVYLMSYVKKPNKKLIDFMVDVNENYYKWHRYFILLFIPFLILLYRKKDYNLLYISIFFGLLNIYYLLATGISFWQGDRLTLAAIGIFSILYIYMLSELFRFIFNFVKSKINSMK